MEKIKKKVESILRKLTDTEVTLLRGGVGSFIVKVVGAGLSFGSHVALARILKSESFGVYVYALNCAKIAVLIGTLGFSTASVRFVSEYISSKRWTLLKEYLNYSRRNTLVFSVFVAALFGIGSYLVYASKNPEQAWTFAIAAVVIPLSVRRKVGSAELRGLKQVVRAQFPKSVVLPSVLVLIVYISCPVIGLSPSGLIGMAGYVVAATASVGFIDLFRKKYMPSTLTSIDGFSMSGRRVYWLKTARDMVLIAGFNMVLFRADTIMVGSLVSPEAAGIYSVASKIAFLQTFGLVAVTSILSPVVSDLYSKGRHEELQNSVRRGAQGTFSFALLVSGGILIFQNSVLEAFGPKFLEGKKALWALLVGQLINSLVGPALVLLNMTGHQRVSALILGGSATLNIVLNAILVPFYGLNGAGIATAATIVTWNVFAVIQCKKNTGILPTPI